MRYRLVWLPLWALVACGPAPVEPSAGAPAASDTAASDPDEADTVGTDAATPPRDFALTDITDALGLAPARVNGVALVDYDGDGHVDLALGDLAGIKLYRNTGDGHFVDVTGASGLRDMHLHTTRGLLFADLDGDEDLDLFVTRIGPPDVVLINHQGRFRDASAEYGVADVPGQSEGASAGDLDGDGDLDVYVSMSRREVGGALVFGSPNRFWRNEGGRFVDATAEAGLGGRPDGYSFGSVLFDVNDDGALDVFVVHDLAPDELLFNDGQGRFESRTKGWLWGHATGFMGIDLGDLDGDGLLDIYATNWGPDQILRRDREILPAFEDVMRRAMGDGLDPTAGLVGWGCALADLDDDGDPDLLSVASFTDAAPSGYDATAHGSAIAPGAVVLIENRGGDLGPGSLADVSEQAGPALQSDLNGFGLAVGDIDRDGDLDALVGIDRELSRKIDGSDPAIRHVSLLLRNDGRRAQENHSVQVRLRDPGSANPYAVGARVEVRIGTRWQVRVMLAGNSYLSTSTSLLHFGLGQAEGADEVRVIWPGGQVQTLAGLPAGEWVIERGKSASAPATPSARDRRR